MEINEHYFCIIFKVYLLFCSVQVEVNYTINNMIQIMYIYTKEYFNIK